jgi:hypothetical protein
MTTKMGDNGELPDDGMKPLITGHLLIRDKVTGEVLCNQRDNLVHQAPLRGDTNAAD